MSERPGIDDPLAMARDVNNNGSFESTEVFVFTKDHLGSIRELSDLQQNPIQRYNYSAYGRTRIEKLNANSEKLVVNPYAYTSRELDESGDYFYRARYYDAWNGRFLSLDPIGFAGGDTNLYRYVKNLPIQRTDPRGLKIYDLTGGQIPQYLKDTDIYQSVNSQFDVVILNTDLSGQDLYGVTRSNFIQIDFPNQRPPNNGGLQWTLTDELSHVQGNNRSPPTSGDYDHMYIMNKPTRANHEWVLIPKNRTLLVIHLFSK